MSQSRIYALTSIGRPLDPRYLSNKAVMVLMPLAAVIAGVVALVRGGDGMSCAGEAVRGLFAVFFCWALARELSPDDPPGAFVSMALAFLALLCIGEASVLLVIIAMFLVRIVNRSTGLVARYSDSVLVLLLNGIGAYALEMPLLPFVGALGFAADAGLRNGLRRHWWFAVLGVGLGVAAATRLALADPFRSEERILLRIAVAVIAVSGSAHVVLLRSVAAVGDIGERPLDLGRVRAGVILGLLVALQALPAGAQGATTAALLWATFLGVAVGHALRMRALARQS